MTCPTQTKCPKVNCPTQTKCPKVTCPTQTNCPKVTCPAKQKCPKLNCLKKIFLDVKCRNIKYNQVDKIGSIITDYVVYQYQNSDEILEVIDNLKSTYLLVNIDYEELEDNYKFIKLHLNNSKFKNIINNIHCIVKELHKLIRENVTVNDLQTLKENMEYIFKNSKLEINKSKINELIESYFNEIEISNDEVILLINLFYTYSIQLGFNCYDLNYNSTINKINGTDNNSIDNHNLFNIISKKQYLNYTGGEKNEYCKNHKASEKDILIIVALGCYYFSKNILYPFLKLLRDIFLEIIVAKSGSVDFSKHKKSFNNIFNKLIDIINKINICDCLN